MASSPLQDPSPQLTFQQLRTQYLAAYDQQLRLDAEVTGALAVTRIGPLLLATFDGGRGFITYADLAGADQAAIAAWVQQADMSFRAAPEVTAVEWKSRAHDAAPGLHQALSRSGFQQGEPESIMIGAAAGLVADTSLPAGITVRRITDPAEVRAVSAMQDTVFGEAVSVSRAQDLVNKLQRDDGTQLWAAEHAGQFVSAGRLEPVAGTDFAGIWGGATLPEWRHQGIYRTLTAERARAALQLGKTLIHSDSTEFSRPILERAGLLKVSSTTPYTWTR
ncbi:hypothetical protein PSET11_03202 [Arthrobacter ulcerisalmonis]|uniref:N-acetyltransferase domain-containing protein n=1 Tax=Arthrobacter ulcerisalmonis TaxID=2483813 RepID=A0A3P5XV19_9MICC|nr:GNAT family N-acetyltransferase [Arthrobacter ulcerisalmonis]VDC32916.1 hypothetical protein PSET11_03202 [Arthrobacter ulcerisalmonis]